MKQIEFIPIHLLHPHPDNPRKELGDLTELAESIKAKGVLQNLTVAPDNDGGYRIVIGHRRYAAAKLAGFTDLPCVVADMTPQEQFETMMVENVQRSDLTVYEQAEGFQTMLDMGGSVAEVAKKTGFSASTVRSRVKLLSLDKQKFQKAEERGATLQDYMKLNEIRDPEARNKVLDHIGTPEFTRKLKDALDDQKFADELADTMKLLEEADWCKERTDESLNYCDGWDIYASFYRYNRKPIKAPKDTDTATYVYKVEPTSVYVYRMGPKPEKKPDPSQERKEKLRVELGKIENQLKSISNTHKEMREEFVRNFSTFNNNQMDIETFAANVLRSCGYSNVNITVLGALLGTPVKETRGIKSIDQDIWNKLTFSWPLRALLFATYARTEQYCIRYYSNPWNGKVEMSVPTHQKDSTMDLMYEGLVSLGYEMCEEEIQMQNGTHPLFKEAADLVKAYLKEKSNT